MTYSLSEDFDGSMYELIAIDKKCRELLEIEKYGKTIELLWLDHHTLTDVGDLRKSDIKDLLRTDAVFLISKN